MTGNYHAGSVVHAGVTVAVLHSLGLDKSIMTCFCHYPAGSCTALKPSLVPRSPFPPPPSAGNHCSACCLCHLSQNALQPGSHSPCPSQTGCFHSVIGIRGSSVSPQGLMALFCLGLMNSPLSGQTQFIYPFKGILVASGLDN